MTWTLRGEQEFLKQKGGKGSKWKLDVRKNQSGQKEQKSKDVAAKGPSQSQSSRAGVCVWEVGGWGWGRGRTGDCEWYRLWKYIKCQVKGLGCSWHRCSLIPFKALFCYMSGKPKINWVSTPETITQEYSQRWKVASYFKKIPVFGRTLNIRPRRFAASIFSTASCCLSLSHPPNHSLNLLSPPFPTHLSFSTKLLEKLVGT